MMYVLFLILFMLAIIVYYYTPILKTNYDEFIKKQKANTDYNGSIIEGLENQNNEYQSYNENNDPLILAKKNASNISFIKERIDKMEQANDLFETLEKQVEENKQTIEKITKANTEKAKNIENALKT